MIDTAQESIIFPFIFIVKFSDRLLSSKMWFFVWVGDMDRKYFLTIWTEMILVAQFIQHFPIFLAGHPVLWTLGYSIKKQNSGGRGGLRKYFFEPPAPPEIFHFFTLPLETPQNCVRYLGNSKPKNQEPCPGNSALFFLGHPRGRQFHFIFS